MRLTHGICGLLLISLMLGGSALVAESATRYTDHLCGNVSTYNPSTRACTGGSDISRTTVGDCVTLMAPGDICYIRGSPTTETIYNSRIRNPPSGTGANGRTVISAYPINRTCTGHNPTDPLACIGSTYEKVVLRPTGGSGAVVQIIGIGGLDMDPKLWDAKVWITVEGIIIDGSTDPNRDNGVTINGAGGLPTNYPACDNHSKSELTTPNHLRFLNNEIRFARNQGFLGDMWNSHIEVIGNWVHDNGSDFNTDHGLYMGGSNNWIVGNLIERNRRYGLHLYTQPTGTPIAPLCDPYSLNNLVERNIARNNSTGFGILRGSVNSTVRNNLAYDNTFQGFDIGTGWAGVNRIYNNTAVNNGTEGLRLDTGADNSIVRNNIYDGLFQHADAEDKGPIIFSNNYSICDTCTPPRPMPNFVDLGAKDFRLKAGDARINAGFNLTSEGVTVDFSGNARPAGGAFDIGAYEFDAGGPPIQTFDFLVETDVPGGAAEEDTGLRVLQGAVGTSVITVTTLGGTATAVALTATGLPSNTTASFSPTSCTPNCTSTLTLDTALTTPEGAYTITVRGRVGSLERTAAFELIVSCN